ncbi:MAG: flagellar biosynthesis protein FlhA, partial [bacterium]
AAVTARFTLDAMPGKQMAIDADLNAGIIGQDEARQRRELVAEESDFYGAMDGASKFVRGDAIAGILILAINIIGGLAVGTLKHGMTAGEAFQVYSLLTIGDGLVAQIPSLILSTATGIIVTRVSKAESMGDQVISQLMSSPQALGITAVVLAILGIIPGMPHMVFLGLSALMGYGAYRLLNKKPEIQEPDEQTLIEQAEVHKPKELSWDDLGELDIIGLEVGYRLIPLVDKDQGGELMSRIKGVRRKLSVELGFLIHAVHIRDNLDLAPTAYRITLMGVPEAESEIYPDKELAINPGQVFKEVEGIATKDPSFGLDAVWIEPSNRETAQSLGYTVVDASTVVATHMSQIMQKNAQKLFGYEEAQQVLDRLATHSSKLASDLVPDTLPLGTVTRVLQELLTEHVSIRDFRTIAEVLVNSGIQTKDINTLVAKVREALGRAIVQSIAGIDGGLDLITFDPSLEQILLRGLRESNGSQFIVEPGLAQRIQTAVQEAAKNQEIQGKPAILAVSAELRPWLSRMLRPVINDLTVLAYTELPEDRHLQIVASIGDGAEAAA